LKLEGLVINDLLIIWHTSVTPSHLKIGLKGIKHLGSYKKISTSFYEFILKLRRCYAPGLELVQASILQ